MYWRPNKPEHFVRPLRWLLCLLGRKRGSPRVCRHPSRQSKLWPSRPLRRTASTHSPSGGLSPGPRGSLCGCRCRLRAAIASAKPWMLLPALSLESAGAKTRPWWSRSPTLPNGQACSSATFSPSTCRCPKKFWSRSCVTTRNTSRSRISSTLWRPIFSRF